MENFLTLSYEEMERKNLEARTITDSVEAMQLHTAYLREQSQIKAVTVCFSDVEGRLHTLDYDRRFLLESLDSLTFDGSSIHGLSEQGESDLRLRIDWTSFTFVPADVFGAGKVIVFADILGQDGQPYDSDFRSQLRQYSTELHKNHGYTVQMAPEIEGFLLKGIDAEQVYDSMLGFDFVSTGGYFHSLPLDELKLFIDKTAEVQRAMGFQNEKDHPEVAPSQFEINFRYAEVVRACDQAQLYKLVCRQVAMSMGMTATFLPKPVADVNGSGMHINLSITNNGKNAFYDAKGKNSLSKLGWQFTERILNHAPELCLMLNSSVNAYRRLDPNFEAPNQIKVSPSDRGAMIRLPLANEHSARIEVRSVAPDTNPYLALFALIKTGIEGETEQRSADKRERLRFLPSTIHDALRIFKASDFMTTILGADAKLKYANAKSSVATRSARDLGSRIKSAEVIYHHEVTNQSLWNSF